MKAVGRKRVYSNDAEKQRAYRQRVKSGNPVHRNDSLENQKRNAIESRKKKGLAAAKAIGKAADLLARYSSSCDDLRGKDDWRLTLEDSMRDMASAIENRVKHL